MRLLRRAVKYNDRGSEVVRLQQALKDLGYDVGNVDGTFGYLTLDALRQFQREHRLRVDGKYGPAVRTMLFRPEIAEMRRLHVVQAGERLVDVARRHGVTPEYLRRANRLPPRRQLYEGQRLFIRMRYVIGAAPSLSDARSARFVLRRAGRHLSAIGPLHFRLQPDGTVDGGWDAGALALCREQGLETLSIVDNWDPAGQGDDALSRVLRSKRLHRKLCEGIADLVVTDGSDGVVLDFGGLRFGDGGRLVRLAATLAVRLRTMGKKIFIGVPFFFPGLRGAFGAADIDWHRLHEAVDGVILQTHHPLGKTGRIFLSVLEEGIRAFCTRVPPWKAMLGINLGALEFDADTGSLRRLTYQQAVAAAYTSGSRPVWDEERGVLAAHCAASDADGGERALWIENARSIVRYLRWVERFNMKGVFFLQLGSEDEHVWQAVPHWIKAWRHEPDDPGI